MENNYLVYKHTTPNEKVYIGITSQSTYDRWGKNGRRYSGQPFHKAIKKYGWDNINHEILFENLSKEEAEAKEVELIDFYKSNQKEYGYNILRGLYEGNLNNPKIKEKALSKVKKKVICDGVLFDSASDCAKYLGITASRAVGFLNRSLIMPKEYEDRGLKYIGEHYKTPKRKKHIEKIGIEIVCGGKIYKSLRRFSEENELNYSTVYNWFDSGFCPTKWFNLRLGRIGSEPLKEQGIIENYNIQNRKEVWVNGVHYNSFLDCTKNTGLSGEQLSCYFNLKRKITKEHEKLNIEFRDGKDNLRNRIIIYKFKIDNLLFETVVDLSNYIGKDPKRVGEWINNTRKMPEEFKNRGLGKI